MQIKRFLFQFACFLFLQGNEFISAQERSLLPFSFPLETDQDKVRVLNHIETHLPDFFEDAMQYQVDLIQLLSDQAKLLKHLESMPGYEKAMKNHGPYLRIEVRSLESHSVNIRKIKPEALSQWRKKLEDAFDLLAPEKIVIHSLVNQIDILGKKLKQNKLDVLWNIAAKDLEQDLRKKFFETTFFEDRLKFLEQNWTPKNSIHLKIDGVETSVGREEFLKQAKDRMKTEAMHTSLLEVYALFYESELAESTDFEQARLILSSVDGEKLEFLTDPHALSPRMNALDETLKAMGNRPQSKNLKAMVLNDLVKYKQDTQLTQVVQKENHGLILEEVSPLFGIMRGSVGRDCSSSHSFTAPNAPTERIFLIKNRETKKIKGYAEGTTVLDKNGNKVFYISSFNGRLTSLDTEVALAGFSEAKAELGVTRILVPQRGMIYPLINFSSIADVFNRYASKHDPESINHIDKDFREAIEGFTSNFMRSNYDSMKLNSSAVEWNADAQTPQVKVKSEPILFDSQLSELRPAALLNLGLKTYSWSKKMGEAILKALSFNPDKINATAFFKRIEMVAQDSKNSSIHNQKKAFSEVFSELGLDIENFKEGIDLFDEIWVSASDAFEPEYREKTLSLALHKGLLTKNLSEAPRSFQSLEQLKQWISQRMLQVSNKQNPYAPKDANSNFEPLYFFDLNRRAPFLFSKKEFMDFKIDLAIRDHSIAKEFKLSELIKFMDNLNRLPISEYREKVLKVLAPDQLGNDYFESSPYFRVGWVYSSDALDPRYEKRSLDLLLNHGVLTSYLSNAPQKFSDLNEFKKWINLEIKKILSIPIKNYGVWTRIPENAFRILEIGTLHPQLVSKREFIDFALSFIDYYDQSFLKGIQFGKEKSLIEFLHRIKNLDHYPTKNYKNNILKALAPYGLGEEYFESSRMFSKGLMMASDAFSKENIEKTTALILQGEGQSNSFDVNLERKTFKSIQEFKAWLKDVYSKNPFSKEILGILEWAHQFKEVFDMKDYRASFKAHPMPGMANEYDPVRDIRYHLLKIIPELFYELPDLLQADYVLGYTTNVRETAPIILNCLKKLRPQSEKFAIRLLDMARRRSYDLKLADFYVLNILDSNGWVDKNVEKYFSEQKEKLKLDIYEKNKDKFDYDENKAKTAFEEHSALFNRLKKQVHSKGFVVDCEEAIAA